MNKIMNVKSLTYNDPGLQVEHVSVSNDKCIQIFENPDQYTKSQMIECIDHICYNMYYRSKNFETLELFRDSMFFELFNHKEFQRLLIQYKKKFIETDQNQSEFDAFQSDVSKLTKSYLKAYLKFLESQNKYFVFMEFTKLMEDISQIDYESDISDDSVNTVIVD